ncbi:MAG TPA: hypothetical protein PK431_02365 [Chitinophagales bacterium]|nr:hypothetical protein [Chitinophagales bacterium]
MELLFNELSIAPKANKYEASESVIKFAETVSKAKKNGFKNIRSCMDSTQIILSNDYSLNNWLDDKEFTKHKNYKDLLYGMIILPYIKDEDEEIEVKYVESDYSFEDTDEVYPKTKCIGLASAYLYETLSISFSNLPVWCKTKLSILIESDDSQKNEPVYNVFSKESFEDNDIAKYVEELGKYVLIESDIPPLNKNIHIAGTHHGNAELTELSNRIRHNPYVIEMRSMEWCRGRCNNFIKRCHPSGIIEIVLYQTDRKYSLSVQTTGRNLRETNEIAKILEERYS